MFLKKAGDFYKIVFESHRKKGWRIRETIEIDRGKIMKRKIAYFIIISLLLGYVGNANVVSAKAEIQATVKDMSGVKRKLTVDSVKNLATQLYRYPFPGVYSQVVDGHYYYMRQTGKNSYYTVYRDKGKKVGSFKETFQGGGYDWHAFGWHEGKLYVEFINEEDHKIKISVVDFKQESIKTICTCTLPAAFDIDNTAVYLYQDKIYAIDYFKEKKAKEFDMSSGNLLNTFSFPKPGKNEDINFINIADGKIYYAIEQEKGKKLIVTFWCRDMASNKDKKVFRCKFSGGSYHFNDLIMKGKEIYCYMTSKTYGYTQLLAYSIPSAGGKMQQIGKGEINDFAYNNKYYFYTDKKYRLHRQNRKTGKDKIISGIKVGTLDCTKKGLYVQKYDKWFDKYGYEYALADYSPALYYMNFKGGNVKKIAKYTIGHNSYDGWWD